MNNNFNSNDAETMHLCIAFDENYIRPFYALLTSILTNNSNENLHFHLIVSGVTEQDKERISQWISSSKGQVSFYSIDYTSLKGFVLSARWTIAVYYRLFFPLLVPEGTKRLLYIDTDTLVTGNLREFYNADLEHYPVGAIYDNYVKVQPLIGITTVGEYFNSGVLLIDLTKWRAQKISERTLEYLATHPENIKFVDQCALNAVLRSNWKKFDDRFNFMYSSIPEGLSSKRLDHILKDIKIIHFTLQRPWNMLCKNRLRKLYFQYLNRAAIADSKDLSYDDFAWRKIPAWIRIRIHELYFDVEVLQKLWRPIKNFFA